MGQFITGWVMCLVTLGMGVSIERLYRSERGRQEESASWNQHKKSSEPTGQPNPPPPPPQESPPILGMVDHRRVVPARIRRRG